MRASAACFGVANDACDGCDAAAAVWLDCGAAWASVARAHDKVTIWAATRDLDGKKLNVFDLMWFSLIMTLLTSAVRRPWNHRRLLLGNPCWRIPENCWLARCFHCSRRSPRRKLRPRVRSRRWERFGYRPDPRRRRRAPWCLPVPAPRFAPGSDVRSPAPRTWNRPGKSRHIGSQWPGLSRERRHGVGDCAANCSLRRRAAVTD